MRAIEAGLTFLQNQGVRFIFGIPAGSINALYDVLMDMPELKPVIVKHETSAGYMAAAYTRISGLPSVCTGSSGPGATNLVTAAANAWIEKLPILFITGSVPSTKIGKGGAQELDAVSIFTSITKYSRLVPDAHSLPLMIEEAFITAISGVPGPVHLSIPIDLQMVDIGSYQTPQIRYPVPLEPDDHSIEKAVKLIEAAKQQGVLLLGHGAKPARMEIIRFAEQTGWMVATTPRGKGAFPEDHPQSLGIYGLSGNRQAIEKLNGIHHDVIIVVGSSLGELATCNWEKRLVAGKQLIHIDRDKKEFNKNYIADLTICGDARIVMGRLVASLPDSGENKIIRQSFDKTSENENNPNWNTQAAINHIGANAPDNARFYLDIGEFMTYSLHNLRIIKDQQFDIDINFGAMGSGIGGAIGAQLAEPDRPVICVTGDGCFFMHGLEVLTAKEYHLPILFVIINNARLGMVHHGHMLQYKRCLGNFSQDRIDLSAVVKAMGIRSAQVASLDDIHPDQIHEWLSYGEPIVIEVIVDGNEVPPMGERVKFLEGATY
ncbi:MAG TPA: thiamine pyrophosphate-binding protein [Bacilli bacterium]